MNEGEKTNQRSDFLPKNDADEPVKRMAMLSFWCVLLIPLICFGFGLAIQNQQGPSAVWLRKANLFCSSFGVICGFVIGWIALIKNRRRSLPSKGVSLAALLGIVGNGLLICSAILIFCAIFKQVDDPLLSGNPKEGAAQAYRQSATRLHGLQADLHEFASRQQGETNAALEAVGKILQKQQALMKGFYLVAQPVNGVQFLDMSDVEKPEDLGGRKEILRRFLDANEKLVLFVTNAESEYINELNATHVSDGVKSYYVSNFHEGWRRGYGQYQGSQDVLAINDRWGRCKIAALTLLETNWGKWSYDPTVKQIKFTQNPILEQYGKLVREINQLDQDRTRIRQELLKNQN